MKNLLNFNELSMSCTKKAQATTNRYLAGIWKYAAMVLMVLTLGVGEMWGANFSNGEVIFIYANSSSAWNDGACVKAWFHNSGDNAVGTNWLFDKGSEKMFYCVVPASGTYSECQLQRFASNCSSWWNSNGDIAASSRTSGYNTFYSNGAGGSNCGWKGTYTMYLKGSTDSWASNLATFSFSSGTTFTASYEFTAEATSYEFKMCDSYGNWHGSNVTVSGLVVGAKYRFTGTINLASGIGSLLMSKTQLTFAIATSATNGSVSPTSAFVGSSGVAFEATPSTGYHWSSWGTTSGLTATNANPTSLTATAAGTLTANFAENTYSLTFSHNGHGTIKVGGSTISSGSTANVNHFTTKTLVATASTGYSFSGWTKSGSNTSAVTIGNSSNASTTIKATNTGATITADFTAKTYTITLDKNGADGSDGSATATYNSNSLTSVSHPTYTDYRCDGYYTDKTSGTKIVNADGTLVASTSYTDASSNWTYDGNLKLYAHWTYDVTNYTVTYGVGTSYTSLGSLSAYNNSTSAALGASPQSVRSGQSVTFTASPNTGYTVEGWYTNAACTSDKHDAGSTTYTTSIGAATNVYVKFVEKTWTVSFANDGKGTTSPSSNQSVGQLTGVSISATPNSGYQFSTWTITSGSGSFTSSAGTASNKFKPTANSTITASFSETMTTVTVNVNPASTGTLTVGGAAFTPGNTTTAGVTTSRTVVATAANDYAFSSWSVTGNATGTNSTNTYTLKGNGSGSTGTLTANFTQVPCTLWYHTSSATFATKTGQIIMSYDADEHAYYADVASTPSSPYYFRFYHNGATQYSAAWNGSYPNVQSAIPNGSKITCDQNVGSWDNKSSIQYVGESGTSIRIWFDYQNKKTWITADKDKEYVLRGAFADNNEQPDGMPGWGATTSYFDGLASGNTGTITCTLNASEWYHLKAYNMYTKTWYGPSSDTGLSDGTLATATAGGNGDFYFQSTIAGTYTFTIDKSSGIKIKVDYPSAYQVNYSATTIAGSNGQSSDPTATYNSGAVSVTSGDYVPNGKSVTFTAAAAKSGYTFNGWYTAATGGTQKSSALSYSETISGSITRYARYTQNTHSVTLTNSNLLHGTINTASPVTVGEAEAVQIQATPKSGYMFNGWTKTGTGTITYYGGAGAGQVEDASGASKSTTYITTTGTATLTATWAEDRSSGYYLRYGNDGVNGDGESDPSQAMAWTTEGTDGVFYKKAGETTGTVSYFTLSVPANKVGQVYCCNVTDYSDWYGGIGKVSASITNQTLTTGSYNSFRVCTPTPGDYIFKWDSSTKQLSITYPAGNYVRGAFNSWGWTNEMTGSGPYTATVSLPADTHYPTASTGDDGFKYVINGVHYGKNGTISASSNSLSDCSTSGQNMGLATTVAGNYTFTVNAAKTQVTVTYPTIPAMTGTVGLNVTGARYGDGTKLSPYSVFAGETLTIDKTHTSAPSADSHFKYTYYNGAASSSTAETEITTILSTAGSTSYAFNVGEATGKFPLKVAAYNEYGPDGYKARGTARESSVRYYRVLLAPAVALATDKVSIKEGTDNSFTLTATPSHTVSGIGSVTYKFFRGNSTEEANRIETVEKAAASNTQTATCTVTPTYDNSTNWTYTVQMTYLGQTKTATVTVYRKWDIYVDDVANCNWGAMYIYMWDAGDNKPAAFPGTAMSNVSGSSHWYTVELDSRYPNFLLDKGSNAAQSGNYTASIATYPAGTYWMLENCSTLSQLTLSNPTVTLSASVANCKDITLNGNVENNGGDGMDASRLKSVYFKVGGSNQAATTVSSSDGTFSVTLSNASAGATNTLQAFAENIYGTGSSSTLHYTNVTLDLQSGASGTTAVTAVENMDMPAGATAPTLTGYTFGGYYASTGGSGKQYYTNAMASANTWDQTTQTKTIYAKWTAKQYTVTLNNHGATTAGTPNVTTTYDSNSNISSAITCPAKNGYTFGGYYTGENGTGTQIINASGVWQNAEGYIVSGNWKRDGNVELHAKWTAKTYTVSFNVNGGTASTPTDKTVTFGETYGALPTGMTHASKQFIGWFTASSGGTLVTADTEVTTYSDHTLYAQYENTYSVTVQYKCGDIVLRANTSINASAHALAAAISAPEILGYRFSNWTGTSATFADASSASTTVTVTAATSITANYTVVPTVYFKNNLDWDSVFVTFDCGFTTASDDKQVPTNNGKPYYLMTQLGSSDIYYCEIPSDIVSSWKWNIAFDNKGFGDFEDTHLGNSDSFWKGEFLGRGDFDSNLTMFIPYNGNTETRNEGTYYPTGCWMKYNSTESGYDLYANTYKSGSGGEYTDSPQAFKAAVAGSFEFKAKIHLPTANYTYGFMLKKAYAINTNAIWYTNTGEITTENIATLPWDFTDTNNENGERCGIHTEATGDYVFTVSFATGRPMVSVEYPVTVGDFRLVYKDLATWNETHDASWYQASSVIKQQNNAVDTVSFFVSCGSTPTVELQKCTAINSTTGEQTWEKQGSNVNLSGISSAGVYNFQVTQNADHSSATAVMAGAYTGNYYIRTDASDGGWNNYKSSGNALTYSEYSMTHGGTSGPFSYYFMRHVNEGANTKFVIANDYSLCITDTLVNDDFANEWIQAEANIRFTWNHTNNKINRAYISGSSVISDRFLVLIGDSKLFGLDGNALNISGLNPNEKDFYDDQNWVYEASVKAQPGARIKLTAEFNGKVQYFYGSETETYQILGGSDANKYELRIVYDFKTNRLVTGFIPSGDIGTNLEIDADVMIIRKHQESAQTITFTGSGKLSDVKTVYGAMKFNKYILNNKKEADGHANDELSRFERDLFWISFPFNVKLNDVFGFGTYGKHWIIEYYDGKGRATNGYWADSDPNWKFVTKAMKDTFVLKANEGYVLALDLDELTEASSVWAYGVENVYLYFPSDGDVGGIEKTSVTVPIDQTGYRCDIDRRTDKTVADINKDRRIVDSYWHCVGVPSYAGAAHEIANSLLGDTVPNITPENWASSLPYIYEWNMTNNKVKVKSASSYTFEPMHAYLVQYAQETIEWNNINATPQAVAARRRADYKSVYEFRLDLLQGENEADQTFVSLRDNDEVTTGFDFNYDLTKNVYSSQANLYTVISTEVDGTPNESRAAGNCLPLETEQVTTVPVGVTIKTAGEYTFAMPDGTEGMNVTLLDSEAGITTDMSVETYQVELPAGTYENRFYMTIDPRNAATQIDIVGGEGDDVRTAKILRNGLLYIQRGDRIYDSTGRKLE